MRKDNSSSYLATVITLTYNHENFIRDCLEGILLQQTDFKFKCIVVDDASTDKTSVIVEEYAQKYPDIFFPVYLKENMFSQQRSVIKEIVTPLLKENPTKYVAFCEGDDFWTYPLKLQRQINFLELHPHYSGCFHHYNIKYDGVKDEGQVMFNLRHSRRLSLFDILIEPQFQTATMVLRSEILLKDKELLNYFETNWFSDLAVFLAVYHWGKVYCFKEWWSTYRVHGKGISQNMDDVRKKEMHIAILQRLSSMYNGKYGEIDLQWMRHQTIRNKLANATYTRLDRRYFSYIWKMTRIFLCSPCQFLKEYYSAYR